MMQGMRHCPNTRGILRELGPSQGTTPWLYDNRCGGSNHRRFQRVHEARGHETEVHAGVHRATAFRRGVCAHDKTNLAEIFTKRLQETPLVKFTDSVLNTMPDVSVDL